MQGWLICVFFKLNLNNIRVSMLTWKTLDKIKEK